MNERIFASGPHADHRGGGPRRAGPRGDNPRGGRRSGGRGRRGFGGRARRGDVRAALLALLAEQPRHGYDLIQELTQRTEGVWRPSPGSVYPALSLLEDEGLISAAESEGKRVFTITDQGRAEVERREGPPPWEEVADGVAAQEVSLGKQAGLLMAPVKLLRHVGTPAQQEAAAKILADARKGLYKILAEDDPSET